MTSLKRRLAQRIDHVGVVVRDADAASAYYRQTFGLELSADVRLSDGSARLVYLEAGDTTLQLVQPLGPGPAQMFLNDHGEGLHHLCFEVDDLPTALNALPGDENAVVAEGGRGLPVSFISARPNSVVIELTGAVRGPHAEELSSMSLPEQAVSPKGSTDS